MTVEQREENARRRVRDERVRPVYIGNGRYVVASSSRPGKGYVVDVDVDERDGALSCTCPAAQWDYPCKHTAAVRLLRAAPLTENKKSA